jgi:sugar lactone lactonase YvrE
MTMRRIVAVLAVVAIAAVSALVTGSGTAATSAVRVVARGLDNPRGLEVARSGAVYVAEAGRAGPCVGQGEDAVCFGFNSGVTRIARGKQQRVAGGFVSIGDKDGSFTVGLDDVALGPRGQLWAIMTDAPVPIAQARAIAGPRGAGQLGRLFRIGGGDVRPVAWVGAYERRRNPDGLDVNPNPYAVALDGNRAIAVDAGANTVYSVDRTGRVRLLALIPPRRAGGKTIQAVPTSVAVGPDGAYYVGTLGGEGTRKGGSRVWRVVPGRKPTVFAQGLTNVVGVAFDADRNLYVAQLVNDFARAERTGDFTGSLLRISPGGARTELAKGALHALGGVAVGPGGEVYVSVNSIFPGRGQVVRVTG